MWIMFLALFFGFLSSSRSEKPTVKSRSCSYVGVFHVEGKQRYNLTFGEAKSLCENLSASLAQIEEIQKAYDAGLQTCRYGWIDDRRTVILRHKPHKTCAGNLVGMKFMDRNYSDAFCYDAKDLSVNNCEAVSGIYSNASEKGQVDPGLVSADHENSTSDITRLKHTTALESSTEVYWTNDGSSSVNASQSSTKVNESDQTSVSDRDATQRNVIERSDHENTTSDIKRLKHTTSLESTTEVYWTNDGSSSVNASQRSTDDKETKETYRDSSDWLVILIVIVVIFLILLVCVVAATRKSCCGRKQTLIITKVSRAEGNGTSASFTQQQEMITLMNTEKIPASNSEVINISLDESTEKNQQ